MTDKAVLLEKIKKRQTLLDKLKRHWTLKYEPGKSPHYDQRHSEGWVPMNTVELRLGVAVKGLAGRLYSGLKEGGSVKLRACIQPKEQIIEALDQILVQWPKIVEGRTETLRTVLSNIGVYAFMVDGRAYNPDGGQNLDGVQFYIQKYTDPEA